jgi:hypothetical protein
LTVHFYGKLTNLLYPLDLDSILIYSHRCRVRGRRHGGAEEDEERLWEEVERESKALFADGERWLKEQRAAGTRAAAAQPLLVALRKTLKVMN